jgi:hypothetical protein
MLISVPGASLSVGWAVSLLGAKAPAGSHLSHCSHRSLAPSTPINIVQKNKHCALTQPFIKREVWLISAPGCSLSAPINFFIHGFLPKNLFKKTTIL